MRQDGYKRLRYQRLIVWLVLAGIAAVSIPVCYVLNNDQDKKVVGAISWVVASRTFIVDPGHGGEDPGKVGSTGIYEKDINLAVALKLKTLLSQGGGQVILTRESDEALSSNEETVRERKRADLNKRVELAQNYRSDLYIALHCNAFPASRWRGAQTFYAPQVAGSKELASFIQEEIISYLGNTTRQPKTDTTSLVFKKATMPIVNVEMGFLSNPEEEKLLQDPVYQDKVAWAIYAGVVRFLSEYGDSFKPAMSQIAK